MKSYSIAAACVALAGALAISAAPAQSQQVSAPVSVRPVPARPKAVTKNQWLKGEVIHADANLIIVREETSERAIHTFTFAPALKEKMLAVLEAGGYQFGDKVKILHEPGKTVALKIGGKPSRPI